MWVCDSAAGPVIYSAWVTHTDDVPRPWRGSRRRLRPGCVCVAIEQQGEDYPAGESAHTAAASTPARLGRRHERVPVEPSSEPAASGGVAGSSRRSGAAPSAPREIDRHRVRRGAKAAAHPAVCGYRRHAGTRRVSDASRDSSGSHGVDRPDPGPAAGGDCRRTAPMVSPRTAARLVPPQPLAGQRPVMAVEIRGATPSRPSGSGGFSVCNPRRASYSAGCDSAW